MYRKVGLPADSFTIFDKVDVNGPNSLETFAVLKQVAKEGHDAAVLDILSGRSASERRDGGG